MSTAEDSSTPRYAIFTVNSDWCFEGTMVLQNICNF